MKKFNYSIDKNSKLKLERGISFEEIIALIESDRLVDVLDHPNLKNYPNQKIYIIDVDGYMACTVCGK